MNIVMELLREKSAQTPKQIAIVTPSSEVTFENLLSQVISASEKLSDLGVKPKQTVLILLPGYQNWVVSLALWRIGAVSISSSGQVETVDTLKRFHWCVSAESDVPEKSKDSESNLLGYSPTWFEAKPLSEVPDHQFQPNDIVRGISTSGSTGKNKLAAFSHRALKARIYNLKSAWTSGLKEYNFMPIGSTGGLSTALSSLVSDNPYFVLDSYRDVTLNFLEERGIQELTGSPQQIGLLIKSMREAGRAELPVERVKLAGSSISAKQLLQIQSALTADVLSIFGSTETGTIFTHPIKTPLELAKLGQLAPWASYQILDAQGSPVPEGEVGELTVRSEAMFEGYFNSCLELTLQPRQEFFATGDQAVLSNGEVSFVGRFSDVINVAGEKIDAVAVESYAKTVEGVLNAMSFASEDESGLGIHVIAISTGPSFAMADFQRLINGQFGQMAPSLIWKKADLPSGELGKPARWVLEQQYRELRGI